MRHKHRDKHKHKHKTTSISYGRTKANSKENSFCFVFVNLRGKFILCYFAYAYVASENQALQSRFYTLAPISVLYVNISSSSLRSLPIDPFVSFLPATYRQYFILVLPLPLRWLRVTFVLNILIALNFPGQ